MLTHNANLQLILDLVGVCAVGGSVKALGARVGPVAAVLVGVIAAVGGCLLRDVLAGQVPEVLRRDLYAVPALPAVVLHLNAPQPLRTGESR